MTTPSAPPANARFTRETAYQAMAKLIADVKASHTFSREHDLNGHIYELYGPYGSISAGLSHDEQLYATVAIRNSIGVKFSGGKIHGDFTHFKQSVMSGPEELEVAINNILNILAVAKEDVNA